MKKRNAIAAQDFEAGLAKREIVRVENNTQQVDLAEGDRERITALEKGMAELSNQLQQLNENSATPLVPVEDGGLAARVRQLEEFAEAVPEFAETLNDLHELMQALARKQNVLSNGIKEGHDRITQLRHDTTQALDQNIYTMQRIAEGG